MHKYKRRFTWFKMLWRKSADLLFHLLLRLKIRCLKRSQFPNFPKQENWPNVWQTVGKVSNKQKIENQLLNEDSLYWWTPRNVHTWKSNCGGICRVSCKDNYRRWSLLLEQSALCFSRQVSALFWPLLSCLSSTCQP